MIHRMIFGFRLMLSCALLAQAVVGFAQGPPPGDAKAQAQAWAGRGDTATAANDLAAGIEDYRQAAALAPDNQDYSLKLAGSYLAAGLLRSKQYAALTSGVSNAKLPSTDQLPDAALTLAQLSEASLRTFTAPAAQKQFTAIQRVAGLLLSAEGEEFFNHGDYSAADDHYTQALAIARRLQDPSGETGALNGLGNVYDDLGQHERAIQTYGEQLRIQEQSAAGPAERAQTLNNIGWAYDGAGQSTQALGYYEKALAFERGLPETATVLSTSGPQLEAYTVGNIGLSYYRLGQTAKGIAYGLQALGLARQVKDRLVEGHILSWLGWGYSHNGQTDKALDVLIQSLAVNREQGDRASEAFTLSTLMYTWNSLHKPRLAIFYGKQAVNGFQTLRANAKRLDKDMQKSLLQSHAETYRQLADLLVAEGRLPEAEQVLRLLKEEELFDFLQRDAREAPANGQASLTPEEAALEKRYAEIADQVTTLGAERGALLAKAARTPDEDKRLDSLERDLEAANQHFQTFLTQMQAQLSGDARGSSVMNLDEAEGLQSTLRTMGEGAVALYTLVGPTKYTVLLVTPDAQKVEEYAIPRAQLDAKIAAFRQALQNPAVDPRPLGQELYTILFCSGKLARDLEGAKAKTLMWALDGDLSYLPMAALYDGRQYLVERYRNTVFTPVSKDKLTLAVSPTWKALGLGVSKPHQVSEAGQPAADFPALPGASQELHGIIGGQGELPGTIQMDESFTEEALRTALRQRYPLVHIASHFQFAPGDDANSYLLLGDGTTLSAAAMKRLPGGFEGVELLTLSACNTATGGVGADGTEVEGFAALVQKKGAEAVLASLWSVSDASTSLLMQEFYRRRESPAGTTKAEALQEAQLALLRGAGTPGAVVPEKRAGRAMEDDTPSASLPPFKPDPKAPFAHPFYWAPFVLNGNWR